MLDLSGTRGAKQLVVVMIQTMFSAPSRSTAAFIASTSVLSSSPSSLFSSTTGSSPYTNHYYIITDVSQSHTVSNQTELDVLVVARSTALVKYG